MSITGTGALITDGIRTTNSEGDGLGTPAGVGVYPGYNQLVLNDPSFETGISNWAGETSTETITQDTGFKFGSKAMKVVTPGSVSVEGCFYTPADNNLAGGSDYIAAAWVNAPLGATMKIALNTAGIGQSFFKNFTGTGAYQFVYAKGVTGGSGTVSGRIHITTITSAQAITFHVDGVYVVNQTAPVPFLLGANAAGNMTHASDFFTATQGWWAFGVIPQTDSTVMPFAGSLFYACWFQDANNSISVRYDATNHWLCRVRVAGTNYDASINVPFVTGDYVVILARWESGKIGISINGSVFTDTVRYTVSSTMPATFNIGTQEGTLFQPFSNYQWGFAGSGTLTNTDAANIGALTASASVATIAASVASAAKPFMIARFRAQGVGPVIYLGNASSSTTPSNTQTGVLVAIRSSSSSTTPSNIPTGVAKLYRSAASTLSLVNSATVRLVVLRGPTSTIHPSTTAFIGRQVFVSPISTIILSTIASPRSIFARAATSDIGQALAQWGLFKWGEVLWGQEGISNLANAQFIARRGAISTVSRTNLATAIRRQVRLPFSRVIPRTIATVVRRRFNMRIPIRAATVGRIRTWLGGNQ